MLTQVRRLQHHPSIIAWSGNNENEDAIAQNWWPESHDIKDRLVADYKKLYVATIKPIFVAEDRTRPFLVSSPSNGVYDERHRFSAYPQNPKYGDVHYYDYINDCWDTSLFPNPRFSSEYGYQSYPSLVTLSDIGSADELKWDSFLMNYRQHQEGGNMAIFNLLNQHYDPPHTNCSRSYFHYMIYLSQIVQATCVKYETEHYRRLRGDEAFTMGALYWQLNDIWQGPSWSSLEYGGRWKMLHYYAKDFFQPIAVTGHVQHSELRIHIVNDHPGIDRNLLLNVTAHSFTSFQILWNYSLTAPSKGIYASEVHREMISSICSDKKCFCKLKLIDKKNNYVLSQSDVFFSSLSSMSIKDPKLKISRITKMTKYKYKVSLHYRSSCSLCLA